MLKSPGARWTGGEPLSFCSSTPFLLLACLASPPMSESASDAWKISALSTRPDTVSGGDVLIEVRSPGEVSSHKIHLRLDGRDVTGSFRSGQTAQSLIGRVDGLRVGSNILELIADGKPKGQLELVNHPITGPIFSGPHQTPFVCQTEAAGLGPALDADCSAKTEVTYLYKSTDPIPAGAAGETAGQRAFRAFKVFDPDGPQPDDLAQTKTSAGHTVDYIVRRETGTINRAIYMIAFLHQPGTPLPDPWTRTPGWNGRLVYSFGGGCRAGYRQARPLNTVRDNFLSLGYASASSSLNVFGNNCNDVLSAETMMMVKEHFIEQFGLTAHTIGWGGSGGSMQQHLIAQNYPGLLDGIIPMLSFPDIISLITPVVDCALLDRAFESSALTWSERQKTAASGFATWSTCSNWMRRFSPGWLKPAECDPVIPESLVYDPESNRSGTRCDIYDNHINVFGKNPKTGSARQPLDNVGVQYGLLALNSGHITADHFLDLNERVGGYDADGNFESARTVADPEALRLAYETGRINTGGGSLGSIPIIDARSYRDPWGDGHDRVRSFSMRARLVAANGHADNHVILTLPHGRELAADPPPDADYNFQLNRSLRLMSRWLDDVAADRSPRGLTLRVVRNKPAELVDACWDKEGNKIEKQQQYLGGKCSSVYPNHGDPRMAARGPLAGDILKCRLKPIDPADYSPPLTSRHLTRLRTIFPGGVCDYSRPGIQQRKLEKTWRKY